MWREFELREHRDDTRDLRGSAQSVRVVERAVHQHAAADRPVEHHACAHGERAGHVALDEEARPEGHQE
eukprot:6198902-Pleurochrysis_carterae.AAC.2